MKNAFYFSYRKSLFCPRDIHLFLCVSLPSFFFCLLSLNFQDKLIEVSLNNSRPLHSRMLYYNKNYTSLCCLDKVFKAFIEPFKAPQRSMKIKSWVNFSFSSRIGVGRVNVDCILLCQNNFFHQVHCFYSKKFLSYSKNCLRIFASCLMAS